MIVVDASVTCDAELAARGHLAGVRVIARGDR